MRKYISKIGLIFLMAFVIGIGYGVSAKAANDDGLVGTKNLNGTVENSAKIGDKLKLPEKGWKRYDDADDRIKSAAEILHHENNVWYYNNTYSFCRETLTAKDTRIKFNFKGTKLRIITGLVRSTSSSKITILIDNEQYEFSQNSFGESDDSILCFEKLNLPNKKHCVEIYNDVSGTCYGMDAIDIDSTGELLSDVGTNLIATADVNKKSITLNWNKCEEAEKYFILKNIYDKTGCTGFKSIYSIENIYEDKDVKPGETYSYRVFPLLPDKGGRELGSNTVSVSLDKNTESTKPDTKPDVKPDTKPEQPKPDTKPEQPKPEIKGDAVLTITMTNGNIKSYNVSMKTVNKFIEWYKDRASGSNGNPFYEFDKTRNEDEIKTEYIVFDKISSFQVEQSK